MQITRVNADHPRVLGFISELDAYQAGLYPAESNHLDDTATLCGENVVMLGAWEDGTDPSDPDANSGGKRLAGIGAIKFFNGYGELKRMYVPKGHRKKGIAGHLLVRLEHLAMGRGLTRVRLETGIHQKAAISLYEKAGYATVPPFGDYREDPLSVFMEKDLPPLGEVLEISPFAETCRGQVVDLWEVCGLTVPSNAPDRDIQRKLDHSPELFFLARIGNRVIGTCMAGYDGHRGWFYYLGVLPEFRKMGVASQMIRHGESRLKAIGCPKINLMVRHSNTKVIGFYKSAGYTDDPVAVLSKRLIQDT